MTSDRLNSWIHKLCPGGVRLALVHDQTLTAGATIASWDRDQVSESKETPIPGDTIGDQVVSAAQEYADNLGESCKFSLQWCSAAGHPLRTMIYRAGPERPTNEYAAQAGNVSGNAMQAQLLSHIAQQQKVINGSIGVILTAYERAMVMQNTMIETLATRLAALPAAAMQSPEDMEVTRLKMRALEKLTDIGPDVARLAIAWIANKTGADDGMPTPPFDDPAAGDPAGDPGLNGTGEHS